MVSFDQIAENKIQLTIDTMVFNETMVTKTLYWIQGNYFVFWNSLNGNIQNIILERKDGSISEGESLKLKNQINQNLIDFKTRDIVNRETKNIRDILYIKAFANGEDFEDYNLMESSNV
jgi:His-Xaa-Ser system protein HxsD